jgi:ubiquinone/menaquinone biosynthesis C-methylase UbiE
MSSYELIEATLADTQRLFSYKLHSDLEIHLNLKGFNYAWIIDSVDWKPSLRILDVGAGYSKLPVYLAKTFKCEVWAIDDFGLTEGETFWERNQDPSDYIDSHPEIKYVIGRIGDPHLDFLPDEYFDIIYSASALEHVPVDDIDKVWRHMDRLLKPNGHMLHGLDIAFPTSLGWKHVVLAMLFDFFYPVIPFSLRRRFAYETPKSYLRQILRAIPIARPNQSRNLGILNMVINAEIVTEPLEHTYHRMIKDGQTEARYYRMGSLLLHMKKTV